MFSTKKKPSGKTNVRTKTGTALPKNKGRKNSTYIRKQPK